MRRNGLLLVTWLCLCMLFVGSVALADGSAKGRSGEIGVHVTVEGDQLKSIEVTQASDTAILSDAVFKYLPAEMVEYNSIEVDSVSGATITSTALKNAVADALTNEGIDLEMFRKEVVYEAEDKELETDIVIVGAGVSGLVAGITAAEAGAKVTIMETNGFAGGNLLISGGMYLTAANEAEVAEYHALDAEGLTAGLEKYGSEFFDRELALSYTESTKADLAWLRSLGDGRETTIWYNAPYAEYDDPEATTSVMVDANLLPGGVEACGYWMVEPLIEAAETNNINILYRTTAEELLAENSVVIGVKGKDYKGGQVTIYAKKVILASGGFSANKELADKWSTDGKGIALGFPSANGWGILAAEEIGAKTGFVKGGDFSGMIYGTYGGVLTDHYGAVLDTNDQPIENLYAVGEMTGFTVMDTSHFSGGENSSWDVYSGRVTGEYLANMLK